MQPRVNIEGSLDFPEEAVSLLQRLFAGHQQVIIKKELGGNFSGSRVFLVQAISKNDAMLPVVVKFAAMSLIEREWQAYERVCSMLYGMVKIQECALPGGADWGAVCYPVQGGGIFAFENLHTYYQKNSAESVVLVLRRLFKALESIHNQSYAAPGFAWRASYDHILPPNLLIMDAAPPSQASVRVVNDTNLQTENLQPGDWVRVEGFAVTKVDLRQHTITLNLPQQVDQPNGFCVRVKMSGASPVYRENQVVPVFEGQVLKTRQSQMQACMHSLLGEQADYHSEKLISAEGMDLPNPFLKIPAILNQYRPVRVALIHGDLNLQNILIDAETDSVSLIDIAEARQDHLLHDFLRLETEIVTHLLSTELCQQQLPPCRTLVKFYQSLHCATFGEGDFTPNALPAQLYKPFAAVRAIRQAARRHFYSQDAGEYYQGLLLYLIGALKFANLDKHPATPLPKQAALWGAAAIAQLLETTSVCIQPPALEKVSRPPHALLLSYNPEVKVLRKGAECFSPAAYGMPLHTGDIVSTFVDAEATVHCSQGSLIVIPAERNQCIDCYQMPQERVHTHLDLRYTAPLTYLANEFSANMTLSPEAASPMGLTPRNTRIAENRPTFRWQPKPGAAAYRISVRSPLGELWHYETSDTTLPYPPTAPSLALGSGNTVILEALGTQAPPETSYLEILDPDSLKKMQGMEADILALSLVPAAKAYLSAQLYQNWGMWTAAIAQLEQMQTIVKQLSSAIKLQLGELYLRTGDYMQAEKQYEMARQRVITHDSAWTVAHIGLACALYAQNRQADARRSLAELNDSEYTHAVQQIRAQIENALPAPPRYQGVVNRVAYARFLAQHIAAHLSNEIRQIPDRFLEQLQSLSNYSLKPAGAWNTLGHGKFAPWETLAAAYLTTHTLLNTLSEAEISQLRRTEQFTPYLEDQARRIAQENLGLSAAQAQDFGHRYAVLVASDPDTLLHLLIHKEP